ncbi:MAG: DNA helicase RecQ [Planctomycetota bacterium]|nr:MAG: DNA helicase RecQ [Planctomycetota bacterium]
MLDALLAAVARHWGFRSLRPLQREAIEAVLAHRDSLVVLPTGGGKSLCYQAPAVVSDAVTVVVSPLISLMKDQVDALRASGIAAAALNSSLSPEEASDIEQELVAGRLRLLYCSPERLALPSFRRMLAQIDIRTIAIDEAHCISHWGHDFRPEYRLLSELRAAFPDASLHAFTATATKLVRDDIVASLKLRNAAVLVGDFDRPNLAYRVHYRQDVYGQVVDVLRRHNTGKPGGDAGIIYCIRRRDVDDMVLHLKSVGIDAMPYHAGMTPPSRKKTQDAFRAERCDLVVATVAFGMGIDRSNVRFVLHTGMPKSIEHYQQETGRAGRDGLEAECVLFYSGADAMLWRNLLEKSVGESETPVDPAYIRNVRRHIDDMENFCRPTRCRHRSLVEYFGQTFDKENCQACDVCLDGREPHAESQTIARKILSCVARLDQRYGAMYVVSVLRGESKDDIQRRRHDQLSTFGLLREHSVKELRGFIDQLLAQNVLVRETDETGDFPLLKLNERSWEVMRNERTVRLFAEEKRRKRRKRGLDLVEAAETASVPSKRSRAEIESWSGVDRDLFETLRSMRRGLAEEIGVAPFVVFSDACLRDLARRRPSTYEGLRRVYGIGESKLAQYGEAVWKTLDEHCRLHGLSRDIPPATSSDDDRFKVHDEPAPPKRRTRNPEVVKAFELFRAGKSLDDVVLETGRAYRTVTNYLAEYIQETQPPSVSAWVNDEIYRQVAVAAEREGRKYLKPIFVALDEKVSYDAIRIVLAHLAATGSEA